MIKQGDARFEVDGREYHIALLRDHDPRNDRNTLSMSVGPVDGGFASLGIVLASFWKDQPQDVLRSLETRVGLYKESEVYYSFHEEDPGELPPGITVTELERSETVSISFFVSFLSKLAPAYAKAAAAVGIKTHEELFPKLLELNEHYARFGDTIH
ncbi:MAG: hypothetical protein KGJ84_15555 [Elusimicrobia bacterium]|nr:hypothetical protein [Elusimicrobiota bacterium]